MCMCCDCVGGAGECGCAVAGLRPRVSVVCGVWGCCNGVGTDAGDGIGFGVVSFDDDGGAGEVLRCQVGGVCGCSAAAVLVLVVWVKDCSIE